MIDRHKRAKLLFKFYL